MDWRLVVIVLALVGVSTSLQAQRMLIDGKWISDPTKPYAFAAPAGIRQKQAGANLVLSATWVGPQRKEARINGRMLKEGDSIKGARIVRIESGRVTLRRGDRRIVIQQGRSRLIRREVE